MQAHDRIGRTPPNDRDAEEAVLASILVDNSVLSILRDQLDAADFYQHANTLIYRAMLSLADGRRPVDLLTLRDELGASLETAGGFGYLVDLSSAAPTSANAVHYAEIVATKATLRGLIRAGSEVVAEAFAEDEPEAIVDRAEKAILSASKRSGRTEILTIYESTLSVLDAIDRRSQNPGGALGIPTGFCDIDHQLSGWQASDLVILAARPAMGKTALSLNLCRNVAIGAGRPVLIFSLEMGEKQLIERLISAEAEVDLSKMRNGYLSREDWSRVTAATKRIAEAPIIIHDNSTVTIQEARSYTRRVKARYPDLGLVMVDYIQLMGVGGSRGDNRVADVSAISRGLKLLARETNVTALALSQLSRKVEERPDKHPLLSDLRESGSLEQDADIVLFIYRDEYYHPETTTAKRQAELIIAKHRNGPTGKVNLYWKAESTKFESLTYERSIEIE
jgi:replicative DNA helicase